MEPSRVSGFGRDLWVGESRAYRLGAQRPGCLCKSRRPLEAGVPKSPTARHRVVATGSPSPKDPARR